MTTAALVVFWTSFAVILYIYFGYPALLFVLSRIRPRVPRHGDGSPPVSIIVAAYNEESMIARKVENTLAVDYPGELELLVASDGSSDGTVELAGRYGDRVRVFDLPRLGKANALNHAAAQARGDILVFTDANVFLERDSIVQLVSPFFDPEVGGVCGNKNVRGSAGADTTAKGENLYVRYDQWQKELESRIGSVFAADGMLYAVRKDLYVPIADPAQADDIAISTRVVLQGHRLLYEPRAVAWEEAPSEGREEFRRKIRVTNHSVRALLNLGGALFSSGFYSVELLSHKLVRHLIPFFLIALLLSNAVLATRSRFFAVVLILHLAFYLLAIGGALLRRRSVGRFKLFSIPYYFSMVNSAALLGVLSILRRKRHRTWTPRGR